MTPHEAGSQPSTARSFTIYGGVDPRDTPLYTYREAARATGVPPSTVRAWVAGTTYGQTGVFNPVLSSPDSSDSRLSFLNLVEIHILRALRTFHYVDMLRIREAIEVAEEEYGIQRLLLHRELHAGLGRLFIKTYADLIELARLKQQMLTTIMDEYITRIAYDETDLAVGLFPWERLPSNRGRRLVSINAFVAFGSPVVTRLGVSTAAIAKRADAGEKEEALLADYSLTEEELQEALLYESAA